ncbi:MAG: hypothetical protein IPI79_08320 [Moraxellaceae bacterium]|nr:hypothetical protein [Moraxellaceae bacterium]
MTIYSSLAVVVAALLLSACATLYLWYGRITKPYDYERRRHLSKCGYGVSGDESEKAATFNANESCAVFKKIPVVSKMDSKYQGSMDESVNKTVNAVSGILKSMTGKNYGTTATEKDYKTSIEFRCQ